MSPLQYRSNCRKEVADITTVLNELARTIESELEAPEYQAMGDRGYRQLKLFSDAESDQWERNHDALRARLDAIPAEILREAAAIRARFADPQPRMFPVAHVWGEVAGAPARALAHADFSRPCACDGLSPGRKV